MATFLGGDVLEIVCVHLGTRYQYSPKANEGGNLDKGLRRTNDDNNQLTSNGQNIRQINNTRWSFDCPIAIDLVSGYEEKSLALMSGSPVEGIWVITHISGAIFKGKGSPVGDIQSDSNTATMTLKIAGAGELETI
jgi:hypothetical protein